MEDLREKHVFVSYVHDDNDRVDALCKVLEAAQIPYWRDRNTLAPGDAWKLKIRQAIQDGSLVFLGCFSDNSRARDSSYMNEEMTLAVDEFRKLPPGRTWLIPVRFDEGEVPTWDLGAGRFLSDINYVDLFGEDHAAGAASLVATINRLMGEKQLGPASIRAAVGQAADAERVDLLTRATKEMLLDTTRRIELSDLISEEVARVMSVLGDPTRVTGNLGANNEERIIEIVRRADELWNLTKPFCASLQVAARWGAPDSLGPWAGGLRSFLTAAWRVESGTELLLSQRHLPGLVGIVTATLASASSNKWDNLRSLILEPTIRSRAADINLPLVESTDFYKPFGYDTLVPHTLAAAALKNISAAEALVNFTERRQGKYFTPVSEWLHYIIRPLFADQISDQETYDFEFDRMEVLLGTLAQDQAAVRGVLDYEGKYRSPASWYGRATWRSTHGYQNHVEELRRELSSQGDQWGPLRGGLFGSDRERVRTALEAYGSRFDQVASSRF